MIAKIGGMIHWFKTTATLVGIPVLLYLLTLGFIGCVSQVTCTFFSNACRYSFTGSGSYAAQKVGEALANKQNVTVHD